MADLYLRGPILASEPFLGSLQAVAGEAVEVEIDSIGGSVWVGLQLFNALTRHRGLVTVNITGLAASMASAVAMAGDVITIHPGARMMIHAPSAAVRGRSSDLREMANLLDKIDVTMRNIYSDRSSKRTAEVAALMAAETWFSADEAVEAGFADRIHGRKQTTAEAMNAITAQVYREGPWARRRS